jgi:hypothetical protein
LFSLLFYLFFQNKNSQLRVIVVVKVYRVICLFSLVCRLNSTKNPVLFFFFFSTTTKLKSRRRFSQNRCVLLDHHFVLFFGIIYNFVMVTSLPLSSLILFNCF